MAAWPRSRDETTLTPGHHHEWRLLAVDFEDNDSVTTFACSSCPAIWAE